jgi:hypothetical protein
MAASLSRPERLILEAVHEVVQREPKSDRLTDLVRRAVGQLTGSEFRQGVAELSERGLLHARFTTKANGEIARVEIERVTLLGRRVVGR